MKSLKPPDVAVEDYKQRNFKDAEANNTDNIQKTVFLPNTDQRILSANVLKLQRMIGNKAVQRLLIPRTTNAAILQREPKKITDSEERFVSGTNEDGILTVTLTDSEAVNGKVTDIAVVNGNSDKINIKKKHTQIENNGDSVTITINLNETKGADNPTNITIITFRIESGGSSETEGEQQGDDSSSASLEFPPIKTEADFTDENSVYDEAAYRDYLIEQILTRGKKKEEHKVWRKQPYNFDAKLLQPLSTSDLVDLLTITTERKNYKAAQCFVSNPEEKEKCLKENPD